MNPRRYLYVALAFGITSCGTCSNKNKTGRLQPVPVTTPSYTPLRAPQRSIPLPAFFVGRQDVLDGGCLTGGNPTDVAGPDELTWKFDKETEFKSNLKATFEKYLVDAGLSADFARTQVEQWEIEAKGLSYRQVQGSTVKPNFTETCSQAALGWFVNSRRVALWGVKASEVSIKIRTGLSQQAKLAIEAAVSRVNADMSAGFAASVNQNQQLEIKATDAFIGVLEASLVSQECQLDVELRSDAVKVCDGNFTISGMSSVASNAFVAVSITPVTGQTHTYNEEINKQVPRQLGDHHVAFLMPYRESGKIRVRGQVWLVGVSGVE